MLEVFLLVLQIIFSVVDFGLFCCSIIGNSVVIYVISRDKKLKSKSNLHILSVATADLFIGLFGIPLGVYAGLTGAPTDFLLCLMLNSFLLAVFTVSIFSLLAVSVDRFWAVCYPVTYHVSGTKTTKIIIVFCWFFGILLGFLPTFGWNSGRIDNKCDLRVIADMDYLLFVCGAIASVSSSAIILLYVLIYRAVLKQAKKRQEIVANPNESVKRKNEIRAANTLAMIVGTFIVLWMPGNISLLIIAITKNRDFPLDMLKLSTILVHLNAAIDPIIYAYRMKNIREALNKLFVCCKRSSENSSNSSSSNDNRASVKTLNSSSTKISSS